MATITIRLTDEEKDFIEDYAKNTHTPVSQIVREIVFEELEKKHERKLLRLLAEKDIPKTYSFEEVCKLIITGSDENDK